MLVEDRIRKLYELLIAEKVIHDLPIKQETKQIILNVLNNTKTGLRERMEK